MTTVKLRLTGDSEQEVRAAIAHVQQYLPGAKMLKPREGSNPRYADNQKWFSYGELTMGGPVQTSVVAITGETIRLPGFRCPHCAHELTQRQQSYAARLGYCRYCNPNRRKQ